MMGHFKKRVVSSGKLPDKLRTLPVTLFFCALLPALCFLPGTAAGSMDLADGPLMTQIKPAPANIMILLDDSGSMDFEVMTPETDTYFNDKFYVFSNPDNVWSTSSWGIIGDMRKMWKSQWAGYNKMYYDPRAAYVHWPEMDDADTRTPRSHPKKDKTFDIRKEYYELREGREVIVDDGDSGFSTLGEWQEASTSENTAYDDDWQRTKLRSQTMYAYWRPNLIPDIYDIYVRWVEDKDDHSKSVYYQIYADGTHQDASVKVNQTSGGGEWKLIGQESFEDDGYVRLRLDSGEADSKKASADAVKFVPAGDFLSITRAHYYTWEDLNDDGVLDNGETVYLVNFVDSNTDGDLDTRDWYTFDDADGDDEIALDELTSVAESAVPASLKQRTTAEDLQNFANWYSFYHRRELTAIGALATAITGARGMNIGFFSIHERIKQPVLPVNVDGEDRTDDLLDILYTQYDSKNSTPLRSALMNVGRYFDADDGLNGKIGDSPYASAAAGGECQQCFVLMMTDGAYNGSFTFPTTPEETPANVDGGHGDPYEDDYSSTLADIAMYYYEKDLSDGLGDRVPTSSRDTATHQHMVTYGIGFGIDGTLTQSDYDLENGPYPTWPDPSVTSGYEQRRVDDMWHATVNGRGNFLTAKNPQELADAIGALMDNILNRLGSASSVSINGDSLFGQVSDDVLMFHSTYNSNDWSGDVRVYTVNDFTGEIDTQYKWSAAASLKDRDPDSRNILTYDGSKGIAFDPDDASIDWESLLNHSDYANIMNYVRGQDDIENFRDRPTPLGDIVHSSPVFENDYIYVGANDGMLHAFEITSSLGTVSGVEKFAYVPSLVHQNLYNLTLDTDPLVHKYYVDLSPTVATGYELLGGDDIDQTILVGGLGKGGQGYFALDITNPASMTKDQVLWEFPNDSTSSYESDMGYSFSKPLVVQTNSEEPDEAWVVITGNGYDSGNGDPVLFVLNLQTGAVITTITTIDDSDNGLSSPTAVDINYDRKVDFVYAGDLNGNMWKFDFTGNAASTWAVAYKDGGNKPLFQARDSNGVGQPITIKPEVMFHPQEHELRKHGLMVLFGTGKLLEESDLTDTQVQTVYGIWDYGDRALWPGPWGRYSKDDDQEYVGAFLRPQLSNPNHLEQNVTLLEQTATTYEDIEVEQASGQTFVFDVRVMSGNEPNWYTEEDDVTDPPSFPDIAEQAADIAGHAGWYWDLPKEGERVIVDVLLRDGRLIVIPFTPDENPCNAGGTSFLMEIDAVSGGRSGGIIFDINNDGVIDARDLVTVGQDEEGKDIKKIIDGMKLTGSVNPPAISIIDEEIEVKYLSSSSGAVHTVKEKAVRLGVTYWKELDK